jgi:hypothetical protein
MKKLITLLPLALVCMVLQAQQADSVINKKKKITFTTGVAFNSGLNYYGRTDSLKSQAIYPFAGITLDRKSVV